MVRRIVLPFFLAVMTGFTHAQEKMNPQLDNDSTIEIVNIENPAVQAFLADSTYFYDDDYNTSVILNYNKSSICEFDRDLPNGKVVCWKPSVMASEIESIRITVSENSDFSDSVTYSPKSLDANTYTISNMLPQRKYYYKVEEFRSDETVSERASGVFRTIGQVRMIRVDGSRNVRDLGGWMTQFGVPIRYGKLFRSGKFDDITPLGIHDYKENFNIMGELDLRGTTPYPSSLLGEDVDYEVHNNKAYYSGVTTQSSALADNIQWVVDCLRDGKNVDWHCSLGCDRCGTFSFLIGGLLGMNEIDLCRDYELSTFSGHRRPRYFEDAKEESFADLMPFIRNYGPEDDLAQCFYNYWLSIGIQSDDLDYLRTEMLGIDPGEVSSTQTISKSSETHSPSGIFSVSGASYSSLQKGINIVVDNEGNAKKVYCK